MLWLVLSAGFVGMVHSLAPAHWLPIVAVVRSQRWPLPTGVLGAAVASLGHILVSGVAAALILFLGHEYLIGYEEALEQYAGLLLVVFGVVYAALNWRGHLHCEAHEHHGPDPEQKKTSPMVFLFFMGFSPCLAVMPILLAVAAHGLTALFAAFVSFALGVFVALAGASALAYYGVQRLHHPLFEHYANVLAGLGIALVGLIVFWTHA